MDEINLSHSYLRLTMSLSIASLLPQHPCIPHPASCIHASHASHIPHPMHPTSRIHASHIPHPMHPASRASHVGCTQVRYGLVRSNPHPYHETIPAGFLQHHELPVTCTGFFIFSFHGLNLFFFFFSVLFGAVLLFCTYLQRCNYVF